jgi:hypothetical protein
MALEIQLEDAHQILLDDQDRWSLPEIVLVPVGNLPQVTSVAATVTGEPSSFAERIGKTYQQLKFDPPRRVQNRTAYGSKSLGEMGPIPHGIELRLKLVLRYFDSDSRGLPNRAGEHVVEKVCRIFSPAMESRTYLEVHPAELSVTVGGEGSQPLTLEVHGSRDAAPSVTLTYPNSLVSPQSPVGDRYAEMLDELREKLNEVLRLSPRRTQAVDGVVSYRLDLHFDLSEPSKQDLGAVTARGPLYIPLRSDVPGGKAVDHLLKVQARVGQFNGWLAIDFGTTNSTVTVCDPRDMQAVTGLPGAQEECLRTLLCRWLDPRLAPRDALRNGKKHESKWRSYLLQVGTTLGIDAAQLPDYLSENSARMYEVLKQLELVLRGFAEETDFRRAVWQRLTEIYHEAFRVPPLKMLNLYPVELDPTIGRGIDGATLPSEMEVVEKQDPSVRPLQVTMGYRVAQDRLDSLSKSDRENLKYVLTRFHKSPKRYFGTNLVFNIRMSGESHRVTPDDLMQAGWAHLRGLTEAARARDRTFTGGRFSKVVATYPTVAPPTMRNEIARILAEVGFDLVQTDFDEAISSAVFYLMREFGGALDIGLESLRARCRHFGDGKYYLNVLVFDIGGGTTDLALMRLNISEVDPFRPGEDRGAGGRYYVITPDLLGSSGHMQLGGELMTLRVYRILKAIVADRLASLYSEGRLQSDKLKTLMGTLRERFLVGGRYEPGAIVSMLDREDPEQDNTAYRDALELTERILPTHWADEPKRLQVFHTLWNHAEEAKIALGQRLEPGQARIPFFKLDEAKISELLNQADLRVQAADPENDLVVTITAEQVERALRPVVREAVGIARGMLESKMKESKDQVDWLILSGKSCQLALVDDEIRRTFRDTKETPYFVWNPERVTFDREYAKLATSLGACYAEFLRTFRFAPQEAIPQLQRGDNLLFFDVKNLSAFLPCSFKLRTQSGLNPLFAVGSKLFQLDDQPVGKVRSEAPQGLSLQCEIRRQDFDLGAQTFWGAMNGEKLSRELGISDDDFLNNIKGIFEVDHRLQIELLLSRGAPHYLISDRSPKLALEANLARRLAQHATVATAGVETRKLPVVEPESLFAPTGELKYDIACGNPVNNSHDLLFNRGIEPNRVFRYLIREHLQDGTRAGLISTKGVEHFPERGRLMIYVREHSDDHWLAMGEIDRPLDNPVYRRYYRITLDREGVLRIHPGEVPFWESREVSVLKATEGCVYRQQLEQKSREPDTDRDPFTGRH